MLVPGFQSGHARHVSRNRLIEDMTRAAGSQGINTVFLQSRQHLMRPVTEKSEVDGSEIVPHFSPDAIGHRGFIRHTFAEGEGIPEEHQAGIRLSG